MNTEKLRYISPIIKEIIYLLAAILLFYNIWLFKSAEYVSACKDEEVHAYVSAYRKYSKILNKGGIFVLPAYLAHKRVIDSAGIWFKDPTRVIAEKKNKSKEYIDYNIAIRYIHYNNNCESAGHESVKYWILKASRSKDPNLQSLTTKWLNENPKGNGGAEYAMAQYYIQFDDELQDLDRKTRICYWMEKSAQLGYKTAADWLTKESCN